MFSKLWHKMTGHRRANPEQSYRAASAATGIPKSTLHVHDQGGTFMMRVLFGTRKQDNHFSNASIYRTTIEIEAVILRYQELQEQGLKEQAAAQKEYIEVVLGADETWLDRMLLVCQELSSGYLFLNSQARKEALKTGSLPSKSNCLYRNAMDNIHKIIHPFSATDLLQKGEIIKQTLLQSIAQLEEKLVWSRAVKRSDNVGYGQIGEQKAKDSLPVEVHLKAERQIPQIIAGVESWQEWLKERVAKFIQTLPNELTKQADLQIYLLQVLLPWIYWQEILKRTPPKARNKKLCIYYEQLINESSVEYAQHLLTHQLSSKQMQKCLNWAQDIVCSFQRSSSQVEGRNGYLAFIHKANRGLPETRLKVLTVIHNFDIKRSDGSTPAQRLWKQDFPDLFEFILQNVTGLKEPRRRSSNSLIINTVRA